jgi:hypothetical protein
MSSPSSAHYFFLYSRPSLLPSPPGRELCTPDALLPAFCMLEVFFCSVERITLEGRGITQAVYTVPSRLFEQRRSMSVEENLHQLITEDPESMLRLAQAVMERLHAADGSGADELLAAQDTETLRDLHHAAALLELHAHVQLYARNEWLYHTNRAGVPPREQYVSIDKKGLIAGVLERLMGLPAPVVLVGLWLAGAALLSTGVLALYLFAVALVRILLGT